jgi:uroporphyrinogen-III synthase
MRNRRVAILEARLGEELGALVERRGGRVLHAPALAELPDLDLGAIGTLVASLEERPAQLAVFQTAVGTEALFAAADSIGVTGSLARALQGAMVIARGPKPSGALRRRGVRIDRNAAEPFTTAEVLAAIADVPLAGARVLVQRYGAANVELDAALAARGAEVLEIPLYRWSLPADSAPLEALLDALARTEVDAVVFTNAAQARNLFTVARRLGREPALREALARTVVASIGPVASAALRAEQVRVSLEASPPKLGALVAALDAALS